MASLRMAAPLKGAQFNRIWEMSVATDPKILGHMDWPAKSETLSGRA